MTRPPGYGADLARIHSRGFSALARSGAAMLVDRLRQSGFERGLVIELGSGSGESATALTRAGYDVLGIERSRAMLRLAGRQAPLATFVQGSAWTAPLPPAVAVTALGEVLSYRPIPGAPAAALARLARRIHRALVPGGLFLFDFVTPARLPPVATRSWVEGRGWAVLVESRGDRRAGVLSRRIVTFTRDGRRWRRSTERHEQQALAPSVVSRLLQAAGFRVEPLAAYGGERLRTGQAGVLAVTGARARRATPPRPRRRARPSPRR